ncbi:MAG: NAD(P)-binding domain-containing protein [Winogradskyella sp.]|uniref:NADPH-dependent F420 reductase n=1 Tax=Winogradskyella sp. TaxID=1883156 RepID=UPI0025F9BADD|nr:NAD(P)-binding domain-containing protein [Winogradskyella sp.]NRB61082.1 NAD(P)-binding domain-containing protein [Winogradskyella sp.]
MMKRIGIIGSGTVGKSLGEGFVKYNHNIMLGTRNTDKLSEWKNQLGENAQLGSVDETAKFGDILILATKGTAAKDVIKSLDKKDLMNKTIIDATNPISDVAPEDGVLKFFTEKDKSLMEELQDIVPEANFVKAFNTIGSALMVNPEFESQPTMFIAGNNTDAKSEVAEIVEQFGFEAEDMGTAKASNVIEQLCILWCIPGFRDNKWNHAFKLLKSK